MFFPIEEYRQRLDRTRRRMEQAGIEVLLLSHPANMSYLTGYDGWSFYVHQGVLVALDQEQPIWVGRGMDANGARLTTWLDPGNIRAYADDYVQSATKHPMMAVADVIREKGWARRAIGVEMDQFYFTHRSFVELEKALPGARFLDANLLVNFVRQVKSEREIECLKRAGKIAEVVMRTAIEAVRVGARECDVAAEIARAQYRGTPELGGDYPAIVPLMMAGEGASTPHLTPSEKRYAGGQPVLLELAGVYRHYHAPIARTIHLGPPPAEVREIAGVVLDGLRQTVAFIRPGVTAEEVEARWRRAIAHSRVVKESRLGYSIGLSYPPDWGEQTLSLRPGDRTVLAPNMALHLIPGIWLQKTGFEVDAAVRVTERGCEELYDFPKEMVVK